ncbi:transcriptional regulator PpsR [Bradyrhizobium guangzhouense]|uniref:Transcriptional regulator PpsR n=1 Tax=Bradyrhizobium guangzhouense TaxID=1325095 RepID=A0AAE5WWF3_9BRAD|nr:transcriptional regulator PpsR [Bradyrhizobium guangzhouense]QAU44369.1 transcriptional regulator PpsR [Bradyrhizobium guangzhouense]RXH09326.1 transcriptional regulator PpsR [Bradyrhizobium guangzhouense]RXH10061.1 transcriptional regulator PpsR [Bradyrhizobium guangzhouense]
MSEFNAPQPDVTLLLDMDGVIREVTLAPAMSKENIDAWVGRPWSDVVGGASDKIQRMMQDTQRTGISAFRQITQKFPSGLELPMEFTTVLLGGRAGMLAIGKNLQAVAELQARLISAQQTIERDYWKLREIETRYRLVIEDSNDAVLLVKVADLRIVEANRTAATALAGAARRKEGPVGRDFLQEIAAKDREPIELMLRRVRDQGKAPGIVVHLGAESAPWTVRGSLMTQESTPVFLLQMTPIGKSTGAAVSEQEDLEDVLDRLPDPVAIIDDNGEVKRANRAFAELVEIGSAGAVTGENLGRWLSRPGADLPVLISNIQRHGVVRLLSTTVLGELGTETEIEISASGYQHGGDSRIVLILRNVARRLSSSPESDSLRTALASMNETVGKTPLRKLVKSTVEVVEQHYVRAALQLAEGNRTTAAEILGLSRQSLYAKLDRYKLQEEPDSTG